MQWLYVSLLKSGMTREQGVLNMKWSKPPSTGVENYQYLLEIWNQEEMSSFRDFWRWFNSKDVFPTLEAMQNVIAFYRVKEFDMLKLGWTLPNLVNICVHKSTDPSFYPFMEADRNLLQKVRQDVVGWPIVFTRETVDETFIRKLQAFDNLLLGFMLAIFTPIRP